MTVEANTDDSIERGKEGKMPYYALCFFIIAVVAAVFGFTGIVAVLAGVAEFVFYFFLILSVFLFLISINERAVEP